MAICAHRSYEIISHYAKQEAFNGLFEITSGIPRSAVGISRFYRDIRNSEQKDLLEKKIAAQFPLEKFTKIPSAPDLATKS